MIVAGLRCGLCLTGETGRRLVAEAQAQRGESLLEVIEEVEGIKFYCLGDFSLWRARTLMTKEPETIEWINTFKEGDVFWDIGANIGLYSLYAAKKGARVIAFEPGAPNYLLLNRNIEINGLDKVVRAYCIAIGDRTWAPFLNMSSTEFGGSMSHFGIVVETHFRQGAIGYSVDNFIAQFNPPFPNNIKIDVDGIEEKIIMGANKTLLDKRLRSIQIEGNEQSDFRKIYDAGFKLVSARHSELFNDGPFKDIYNYRYER